MISRIWLAPILALALGISLIGCIVEESNPSEKVGEGSGSLYGTVKDENNNALPGAVVVLYYYDEQYRNMDCASNPQSLTKTLIACMPDPGAMDTVDAEGSFAFNGLSAGVYRVTVEKEGYSTSGLLDTLKQSEKKWHGFILSQVEKGIPCEQEIALQCDLGAIDACMLDVDAQYHQCVINPKMVRCVNQKGCDSTEVCVLNNGFILQKEASDPASLMPVQEMYGYCVPADSSLTDTIVDVIVDTVITPQSCLNDKSCGTGNHCEWPVNDWQGCTGTEPCGALPQLLTNGYCVEGARELGGCDMMYAPVCGMDNITYSNMCDALYAGTQVQSNGECIFLPD